MKYLVTGATGGFGGYALEFLQNLVPQSDIYALVRSEAKGADLKAAGFKLRIGDYTDEATLTQAFSGIDRLLFVSGGTDGDRQAEHKNVVAAAQTAGISYIAYTSFGKADVATSPLAADHQYTEKLIEKSGIAHTFLRNNWYLENEAAFFTAAVKSGKFIYAGGTAKAGWALKREYAEIAARALSGQFDFPAVLELGGPLKTYEELGADLRAATGQEIEIVSGSEAETAKNLVDNAGLPQNIADLLVFFQQVVKSGAVEVPADNMEKYLGKPLVATTDAIKEILK